jgi:hypothetical protein
MTTTSKPKRTTKRKQKGGDFLSTLKSIGNYIKPVAEKVGKEVILPVAMDAGKQALKSYLTGQGMSGGSGSKRSARASIVKQLMKEKDMTLPQASSYIKQHKIAY